MFDAAWHGVVTELGKPGGVADGYSVGVTRDPQVLVAEHTVGQVEVVARPAFRCWAGADGLDEGIGGECGAPSVSETIRSALSYWPSAAAIIRTWSSVGVRKSSAPPGTPMVVVIEDIRS